MRLPGGLGQARRKDNGQHEMRGKLTECSTWKKVEGLTQVCGDCMHNASLIVKLRNACQEPAENKQPGDQGAKDLKKSISQQEMCVHRRDD